MEVCICINHFTSEPCTSILIPYLLFVKERSAIIVNKNPQAKYPMQSATASSALEKKFVTS